MRPREYEVTPKALMAARMRGVEGDVASRIRRMAKRSAICTHAFGNRRFDDYVLNVTEDGVILDVHWIDEEAETVTH